MDYRTVGLVAGYQGRRPASGWLLQILVNLQTLRDPAPRILDSVGVSRKLRIKSYVILQAWRGPAPRVFDSVGLSKN